MRGLDRVPNIHEVALQLMQLVPQLHIKGLSALDSDEGLQKSLAAEAIKEPLDAEDLIDTQDTLAFDEDSRDVEAENWPENVGRVTQ